MTDPPTYDDDGEMQPGRWKDYGVGYFDRQGNRITMDGYAELIRDPEYKRVAQTYIGRFRVSTVWLGFNHRIAIYDDSGPPLIFESMVFYDEPDEITFPGSDRTMQLQDISDPDSPKVAHVHPELRDYIGNPFRWTSEAEATRGHDELCIHLRTLQAKIDMAQEIENAAIDEAVRKQIRKDKE